MRKYERSFLAAANRSYFGIETDITLLKDRSMVLFHDDDLKRLANSDNLIRNMNFKEAMRVELIAKGTYHTYNYHIATPLEYLRICKHYNKYPVIELKWGFDNEAVDKLMELLLEEDMFDKSMIICYTMSTILYLKEKYPEYHTQFLLGFYIVKNN
ncbi:MAG: glycerophosphodiester phosphodiesterase family protein [Christensenellales bacterium]